MTHLKHLLTGAALGCVASIALYAPIFFGG